MGNKRKAKIYVIILVMLITLCVLITQYPIGLSAEDVVGLQEYYKASEEECCLMDYLKDEKVDMRDPEQRQVFLSMWDELTNMEYNVNEMYMNLNSKQKWFARFHCNPSLLFLVHNQE